MKCFTMRRMSHLKIECTVQKSGILERRGSTISWTTRQFCARGVPIRRDYWAPHGPRDVGRGPKRPLSCKVPASPKTAPHAAVARGRATGLPSAFKLSMSDRSRRLEWRSTTYRRSSYRRSSWWWSARARNLAQVVAQKRGKKKVVRAVFDLGAGDPKFSGPRIAGLVREIGAKVLGDEEFWTAHVWKIGEFTPFARHVCLARSWTAQNVF